MTSMPQDFNNFKKKIGYFRILVAVEVLSYYPIFDSSNSLREDVQWIIDKVFLRKVYVSIGFDTFFSLFSTEFLVFACICCCFRDHRLIVMSYC